jgi:hypothetical protein
MGLDKLVVEASRGGFDNESIAAHLVNTAISLVGRSGLQRLYTPEEKERRKEIMTDDECEEFIKIRKEAGLKIDPETAVVASWAVDVMNPYGIYPTAEEYNIGRDHFVRAPGSDIWVWFGDLPEGVWEKIWEKNKKREEA